MAGDEPATLVGWYLTPDWKGSPVTAYTQLPLQNVTLFARWVSSSSIETDIDSFEPVAVTLKPAEETTDTSPEKIVTALKNGGNDDWTDEKFEWYVDGDLYPGQTGYDFNCTLTETGSHTVVCVVYSADGKLLGSSSITVIYKN